MAVTQKNRPIQIATPLGEDVLLFYRMYGQEHLSQLFEFELELLSENHEIDPETLLGENVTIGVQLPDQKQRFFNGYITRFGQTHDVDELACYRASVRPWLWFLSRAANCRIFQNKTAPEIIKQIFTDQGFSADIKDKLSGTYPSREYCVQYRETDLNFVSRLMEEEGIFYYFAHDSGKHQLVLADSISAADAFEGYEDIPFHPEEGVNDHSRMDHVHHWEFAKQVQTGAFAHTDFEFETPKADLKAVSSNPKEHKHAGYEIFEYPGFYKKVGVGESLAKVRLEAFAAQFERCNGAANARGLAAGYKFKLTDFPLDSQNREYLVLGVSFDLSNGSYSPGGQPSERFFMCNFTALDNQVPYRPARVTPKPLVHGAQTAIVTGKAGEEIWVDKYGRVKVQFHWDRYANADENTSCWVRVSHPWAGKGWGMMALPRIGQEVIVDFMEGDPDQPIITGRVYNAASMPPYELPSKASISTIKTLSTKGGGGFNELRFDDTKGEEQVFIHAEKDWDVRVKHDHLEWVGNERHLIVKKDLFEQIDGDQHTTIKGDNNQAITGTLSIKADMDLQEKVGQKHAIDAGQEIHLNAGMNVVIEAGTSITLKAGGGFIVVGPAGVTISGTPVLINSGGSAGSGSGCSPDPAKEPKEADKAEAGSKDAAPAAAKPPKPKTYGPSASVLKMAADSGTPFCEQCAAAAAAAAGQ